MTDWTDPDAFEALLGRAETKEKGSCFEDFEEGEVVEHDPGLVLSRRGSEFWMGQTLNYDPAYWRPSVAAATEGRRGTSGSADPPVHPDYLLACVMGASVEDLSEKGGYFLGRDDLRYHAPAVEPGAELRVESTVEAKRESSSRPAFGIVTWETTGYDAATGDRLLSYTRTNMIPRREPMATDGEGVTDGEGATTGEEPPESDLPDELLAPEGEYFEDFREALDRAEGRDAAVAYRHERGRTMDDTTVAALPLATLNTAKQHHNADAMADSPSGEIVAYGDVTRSIALAHARSDEATVCEVGCDDERFHDFVTAGDTVYGFTRVLDAREADGDYFDAGTEHGAGEGRAAGSGAPDPAEAGEVTFRHFAFDQDGRPVYSGTRTALIRKRT
ncbi:MULTISPECIES: 2-methylfumaryl-CoA hydratase [Halorussus]|uniref:2-methylfumaryl-CoA hydratase n=1 Tax=Halorussus TaxID=1070314 RepID=UPI0020A1674D|nr:2-methylfumaryl-CoA hydratase [Halorussus vallis]USZ76612.1 acyl dehydratase [Halorussus vallis]